MPEAPIRALRACLETLRDGWRPGHLGRQAAANQEQLTEAAVRWAELRADDGEEIHPEFASDILSEMASLARTATEHRVLRDGLCRISCGN
jgi:hypothetical protein